MRQSIILLLILSSCSHYYDHYGNDVTFQSLSTPVHLTDTQLAAFDSIAFNIQQKDFEALKKESIAVLDSAYDEFGTNEYYLYRVDSAKYAPLLNAANITESLGDIHFSKSYVSFCVKEYIDRSESQHYGHTHNVYLVNDSSANQLIMKKLRYEEVFIDSAINNRIRYIYFRSRVGW